MPGLSMSGSNYLASDMTPAFSFYNDEPLYRENSIKAKVKSLLGDIGDWFTKYRLLRIPVLNWCIIIVYAAFLARLTWKFKELYNKHALTTMMVTNILLFGLADTLAQTLSAMVAFVPEPRENNGVFFVKYILEKGRPRRVILDEADDDLLELGIEDNFDMVDDDDEEELRESSTNNDDDSSSPAANGSSTSLSGGMSQFREARKQDISSRRRAEAFSFHRLALFSVWGFIISFFQSPWYAILNSAYKEDNKFLRALKRVLTDQLCFSPVSLACFLSYMAVVMEGGDRTVVGEKLKKMYLPTLALNYAVWPLTQFLNFLAIPSPLQIPFSSTIGVFWNAYLSLKNARSS